MYRWIQFVGSVNGQDCYVRDDYLVAPFTSKIAALAARAEIEVHAPHLVAGLQLARIRGNSDDYRRFSEVWEVEGGLG